MLPFGKIEPISNSVEIKQDCDRPTIDETYQTINIDQQDTGVSVVEFLSALQVITKQF